jgi:hypothetical protein
VRAVLNCHGSFASASCLACRARVPGAAIEREILAGVVPLCAACEGAEKGSKGKVRRPKRKRRSGGGGGGRWESDDDDGDDDAPAYPAWVMKVQFVVCLAGAMT